MLSEYGFTLKRWLRSTIFLESKGGSGHNRSVSVAAQPSKERTFAGELVEARDIARAMIEAYLQHLQGEPSAGAATVA